MSEDELPARQGSQVFPTVLRECTGIILQPPRPTECDRAAPSSRVTAPLHRPEPGRAELPRRARAIPARPSASAAARSARPGRSSAAACAEASLNSGRLSSSASEADGVASPHPGQVRHGRLTVPDSSAVAFRRREFVLCDPFGRRLPPSSVAAFLAGLFLWRCLPLLPRRAPSLRRARRARANSTNKLNIEHFSSTPTVASSPHAPLRRPRPRRGPRRAPRRPGTRGSW